MQLRISHTTRFAYDGRATTSYNQARLTPVTTPEQIVVHTRVDVNPTPWTYTYRDYWGTQVTAFEVVDPHQALSVASTSTVHTNRKATPPPSLSWEQMRSPEVADRWTDFLAIPELVAPPHDLAAEAVRLAGEAPTPGAAAREICGLVHREVEYRTGTTHVASHAGDAWAQRGGVCQDMAHLVIGALRSLGIPTRYVSGYFHPRPHPVPGETVRGESHAWVEWWDDGWHPFDPTNDREPHNRYVVVAAGRDYDDVKPLSGIYSGGAATEMFVDVQVTLLS